MTQGAYFFTSSLYFCFSATFSLSLELNDLAEIAVDFL